MTFYYNQLLSFFLLVFIFSSCVLSEKKEIKPITSRFRAPAYPLITIDPYTSVWSETDTLYNSPVRHWTGKTHSLIGAIRVDGTVYRFMGKEELPWGILLPMAKDESWEGSYTFKKPTKGWEELDFSDSSWTTGQGAFGTIEMPALGTLWETKDIWIRRKFVLPTELPVKDIYLVYSHDDNFELYLNGEKLVDTGDSWKNNVVLKIDKNLLKAGSRNVIAAHCYNKTRGGYVDFGLYNENPQPAVFAQTVVQDSVSLSATQTHYGFTCGPINLKLTFTSPLLPDNLDLLSRPVNYIDYQVSSNDEKEHDVQVYFEITPQWAVNEITQPVEVIRGQAGNIDYLKAGTIDQPILKKQGDNLCIDWGYVYLASPKGENDLLSVGNYSDTKKAFAGQGLLPEGENRINVRMDRSMPAMAAVQKLGKVSSKSVNGYVMMGYDDIQSIQYFGKNLEAWWKENGKVTMDDALQTASTEHKQILKQCAVFDNDLWSKTLAAGGEKYANLCVLAFRQAIAAHKLVRDSVGTALFFSKENFSNGSIATVDVTYPSAPLFLLYNLELLKGMMTPIFYFSESGKYPKPFAAHDLGSYPLANGQTYEGSMPVEECGNMLILSAAIAQQERNAGYAQKHWKILTTWTNYLVDKGLDPENQLCTDDFAGHSAHNANLSIKAILGIASYGKLAGMLGDTAVAAQYTKTARKMAQKWVAMANDGDHYRLTFDGPDTWSQKYNLVWNKLLHLDIFPKEVAQKETAYYLTRLNQYGLPLDSRKTYTKSDWEVWTATMAEKPQDFETLIDGLYQFVTETPDRVPMSDWYETVDATKTGFQARSVVGGYFIKMLEPNK
jgi:hypothetical protein